MIKHKAGDQNQLIDTLSRGCSLIASMEVSVTGFEVIKELYEEDSYFSYIWSKCSKGTSKEFLLQDGFFLKNNQLCIPQCSLQEAIIKEAHGGGLEGHFGQDETLALIQAKFYCPYMV